mmetsp:Transcript_47566/g.54942  ORF Transcript_47566/g.54942 Transcript_47566/m.54942 type:complete len:473 (+) Transcript_47566:30-1448(+)
MDNTSSTSRLRHSNWVHGTDNGNKKEEERHRIHSKEEKYAHRIFYDESRGRTISRRHRTLFRVGIFVFLSGSTYFFNISLVHTNEYKQKIDEDRNKNHNEIESSSIADTDKFTSSLSTSTISGVRQKLSISNGTIQLTSLKPIDYEQFTIRINTWRRPEQLVVSIKHHLSCPGVKQIQIVWCDKENDPPKELLEMVGSYSSSSIDSKKVVIERHEVNSLNERFNILDSTPTIGILSIDDDVLRPCEAIDSGFFKWIKSPHRMVGFDARTHVENEDGSWEYGYLSTTKKENKYSLSLTRYCFIHRDYMIYYMNNLPNIILDTVATNFNCEDIAMTLMISSQTQGQPPLLADLWAMNSMIKLDVETGISGSNTHKKFRDNCTDSFAFLLKMKTTNRLKKAQWVHKTSSWGYDCGANEDEKKNISYIKSIREMDLEQKLEKLRSGKKKDLQEFLIKLISKTGKEAKVKGLIAKKS